MQIKDSETGQGIPYASYYIKDIPSGGGAADGNGMIPNSYFTGYSDSAVVQFTAAGYTGNTVAITDARGAEFVNLLQNSALPEIVITAVKKAKENPVVVVSILIIIILAFVYKKQIIALIKRP